MSTDTLTADILARLAGHDSKRPANAADVAALVGGDERAYWAAIEQLKASRRISVAHIQRASDPAMWLAIWPSGLRVGMDPWKKLKANGAFFSLAPPTRRFQPSPATRADIEDHAKNIKDNTMKNRSPELALERRKHIAAAVEGKTLAEGVTVKDFATQFGITIDGVSYLVSTMLGGGRVARGHLPGQRADRIYDPRATAPTPAAMAAPADLVPDATKRVVTPDPPDAPAEHADHVAAGLAAIADAIGDMEADDSGACEGACGGDTCRLQDAPPPPPEAPDTPAEIEFALWDDGRLSIYDGDGLVQLKPAATARLARLLGGAVPCCLSPNCMLNPTPP